MTIEEAHHGGIANAHACFEQLTGLLLSTSKCHHCAAILESLNKTYMGLSAETAYNHRRKIDAAERAIAVVLGDKTVEQSITRESLLELREVINDRLNSLPSTNDR